jgi:hypothetical protein
MKYGLAHERLGYGHACCVFVSGDQRLVYMSRVLEYVASFSPVESFYREEMQRLAIFLKIASLCFL